MCTVTRVQARVAPLVAAVCARDTSARGGRHKTAFKFRDQASVPDRLTSTGTQVGGLSGIAFDEARGVSSSLRGPEPVRAARYDTLARPRRHR